jgi:hypothetical protein
MKQMILVVACAVPIAACGSKPSVEEKNATVEQVANDVREASKGGEFVKPGKWQSTVTIDQMSMPGIPPDAQAQMKKMISGTHTTETCLTPEEAKKPNANFFSANDQCRYDHFTMAGGKVDAEMHCSQGGTSQVMQMNGSYSADSYEMHMQSTSQGGPAGKSINMKMTVTAKRIGECTGNES